MKKLELKFNVITNHHDGDCSDEECEENEEVIIKIVEYNLDEYFGIYKPGDLVYEADFDLLKDEYEKCEDMIDGSGYCQNKSYLYDAHTKNWKLISAKVINF